MSDTIQEGSIVTLKSGGPRLTVSEIWRGDNGRYYASVHWFGDDGELKHSSFTLTSLTNAN